jgi:hypothetical protein
MLPADLGRVAAVWSRLPETVRAAVVTLVETAMPHE